MNLQLQKNTVGLVSLFLHRAFRFLTNDQCIRLMWVEMDSV
jgi:hypothetical protein